MFAALLLIMVSVEGLWSFKWKFPEEHRQILESDVLCMWDLSGKVDGFRALWKEVAILFFLPPLVESVGFFVCWVI